MKIHICIEALAGDTLLANGVQRRRTDSETNSNGIAKNVAETTVSVADVRKDDGPITLPLTDETNQSSIKKVNECDAICVLKF